MEPVKLCKRGHERTPENIGKDHGCLLCRRDARAKKARAIGTPARGKKEFCKRGHTRTPGNLAKSGACKLCSKQYNQSPERRAKLKILADNWRAKNPSYAERWRATNPESYKKSTIKNNIKASGTISDGYAAKRLGIPVMGAPAELIEIKRLTIQLQRSLKNVHQI